MNETDDAINLPYHNRVPKKTMRPHGRGDGSVSPRPGRSVAGFTLIELLTVIAIIGILAAILIPVVGRFV